jgi:hypothetical protein
VLVLAVVLAGCGGSSSSGPTSRTTSASTQQSQTAAWRSSVTQLCLRKRAAIGQLGSIHITYGGIARVGLPAVKRSLERYLERLQAVLREFAARRRALTTPPSLTSTVRQVDLLDAQSRATTSRLQTAVAGAGSAAELSAAFRTWLATLQRLSERGNTLARQLDLGPECGAPGSNTGPVA